MKKVFFLVEPIIDFYKTKNQEFTIMGKILFFPLFPLMLIGAIVLSLVFWLFIGWSFIAYLFYNLFKTINKKYQIENKIDNVLNKLKKIFIKQ